MSVAFVSQLKSALLAGFIAMLLIGLASTQVWPLAIDLGQHDARFVRGFHEPERFGETLFRWASARSELDLPQPPAGPAILALRLLNGYPESQADPTFTLSLDQHQIGSFQITRRLSGVRQYQVLVPIQPRLSWATSLVIESTVFSPPADPRELGAVVDWAHLAPSRSSSSVPPLFLLVSAFALGAFAAYCLLLVGVRPAIALFGAVGLAAGLAILAVQLPLDILPFIPRIATIPMIGCLGLGLAHLLGIVTHTELRSADTHRTATLARGFWKRGSGRGSRHASPEVADSQVAGRGSRIADFSPPHPPTLRGEHLPLLLAIAWWLLPIFQAVQIFDGAAIGVGAETFWLAGFAALALAVSVVVANLRGRAMSAERRGQAVAAAALGGAAIGAAVHLIYALWYAFTRSGKDFWILFKGTREWVLSGELYDLQAVMTNHVGAVLKVPPFYAMLFTPFVFQDGLQILLFHRLINVGLMLATVLIWLLMFRPKPLWWGVAVAAIVLNSRPLADTIAYGQIDLMLLFLLTCALWAMRRDHDGLAGALLALGVLFKVYPVILLAFFVLKGRWRGLLGFALGMLVYNGLAVAVMGWETHRVYLFEVIPRIGGTTSWVENQTLSGFMARFVDVPFDAHVFGNRSLSLLATAISGLLSLLACWLTIRPTEGRSTAFALQYAQYLLLMVLAVPAAWMHYETLLVLVYCTLLMHLRERQISLLQATMLALSFALINYGNQWSFNGTTVMGILTIAGISYKFYGMLLLGAVLFGELFTYRYAAQERSSGEVVPSRAAIGTS